MVGSGSRGCHLPRCFTHVIGALRCNCALFSVSLPGCYKTILRTFSWKKGLPKRASLVWTFTAPRTDACKKQIVSDSKWTPVDYWTSLLDDLMSAFRALVPPKYKTRCAYPCKGSDISLQNFPILHLSTHNNLYFPSSVSSTNLLLIVCSPISWSSYW